jgi:hypothetical protein
MKVLRQSPHYKLSSFYISGIVLLAALALVSCLAAAATIPIHATTAANATGNTTASEAIFEDGSGSILYGNGTERHQINMVT